LHCFAWHAKVLSLNFAKEAGNARYSAICCCCGLVLYVVHARPCNVLAMIIYVPKYALMMHACDAGAVVQ
jgi:hypothetical protein